MSSAIKVSVFQNTAAKLIREQAFAASTEKGNVRRDATDEFFTFVGEIAEGLWRDKGPRSRIKVDELVDACMGALMGIVNAHNQPAGKRGHQRLSAAELSAIAAHDHQRLKELPDVVVKTLRRQPPEPVDPLIAEFEALSDAGKAQAINDGAFKGQRIESREIEPGNFPRAVQGVIDAAEGRRYLPWDPSDGIWDESGADHRPDREYHYSLHAAQEHKLAGQLVAYTLSYGYSDGEEYQEDDSCQVVTPQGKILEEEFHGYAVD